MRQIAKLLEVEARARFVHNLHGES